MNSYSENYLKNQIETASREQLLIMFYDGAIRFVKRAEIAIDNNDYEQRGYCINKASAIIAELSATLDHEVGGSIAANLDALYDYMSRELMAANVQNSKKSLGIVKKLLSDLKQTWIEAIDQLSKEKKPAELPLAGDQYHKPLSLAL